MKKRSLKPVAIYNGIAYASVVAAIFLWYLLLALFEQRIGTPIIMRPGEEPFAYDTDVMPFVPCCGLIGYLLVANGIYAALLHHVQPLKRAWWVLAVPVFASPFTIPLLIAVTAIFFPYQSEPIILQPEGG